MKIMKRSREDSDVCRDVGWLIPEDKIKPVISSIEMEKTCHRTVIFEGKRD